MSFLSAPKLMMLFNQIGLQKSSLFFRFLIVTAKNLQSIILQHSLRGFERRFEGQLRCNFFFIRIALSRKNSLLAVYHSRSPPYIHHTGCSIRPIRGKLFFGQVTA